MKFHCLLKNEKRALFILTWIFETKLDSSSNCFILLVMAATNFLIGFSNARLTGIHTFLLRKPSSRLPNPVKSSSYFLSILGIETVYVNYLLFGCYGIRRAYILVIQWRNKTKPNKKWIDMCISSNENNLCNGLPNKVFSVPSESGAIKQPLQIPIRKRLLHTAGIFNQTMVMNNSIDVIGREKKSTERSS